MKFRTLLAAAAGLLMASAATAQTVKVGFIGPLTGGGAPWGIAAKVGIELAAKDHNDAGGLDIGGVKHQVEVISYDDKYAAADAVAAYNRLVNQDGVKYIVLVSSSGTMALKQNIEDDGVLAITASYSTQVLDDDTSQLFRLYSAPVSYVPPFIKWMAENLTERRVVIINPNDETGWDQTRLFKEHFGQNGFEVVGEELFERTQSDFTPLITKVMAMNPEIVEMGGTSPATAGLIVRQARELGYDGLFSKMGGAGPYDIVAAAGAEASEGIINMLYADQQNEGFKRLAAAYEASEGHVPNEILVSFYDGTKVMLAAIAEGGDADDPVAAAAAFPKVLPMESVQGDNLRLGGSDLYGVDAEVLSVNYVGVIRDGEPVVIGKTE